MSKVIIPPYSTIQYDKKTKQLNFYKNGEQVTQIMGDYTAFEVFAHDYDIPVGECEELGGYVNNELSACMSHQIRIRSEQLPEDQNIIIDWGDGTITNLSSDIADDNLTGSALNWTYTISHEYPQTGKYIVKIFGNTYFNFGSSANNTTPNIVCRIFDVDLPVASHLGNFSSTCKYCKHLLNVNVFGSANFNKNYYNISQMFYGATNLLSATGFACKNKINVMYNGLFNNCYSLKTTDFILSPTTSGIPQVFRNCYELSGNVENIMAYYFPITSSTTNISIKQLFYKCEKISGTINSDLLWNNPDVIWTSTDAFTGCTLIQDQAPVSWGGNASDDIIVKQFWTGTQEEYDALTVIHDETFYIIKES